MPFRRQNLVFEGAKAHSKEPVVDWYRDFRRKLLTTSSTTPLEHQGPGEAPQAYAW